MPVVGALVIGLMARYGSERIRGHGIPEAIEAILINGSRVEPKVALLKPLSSAISIGSGGPFGAEGPIIMTGGAFGSLIAQFFHLTSAERKTLLVAGAAAGMSATFAAPVAAVLLAVELLLFEWKPRSFIPVALASATAAVAAALPPRRSGRCSRSPPHPSFIGPARRWSAACVAGSLAGALSGAADAARSTRPRMRFQQLPIHWMWWPAIGGLVDRARRLDLPAGARRRLRRRSASCCRATSPARVDRRHPDASSRSIWSVSLGSGTSGGVLAPLLMMGGALGGVEALVLPGEGAGFWPLVSMGAILGGTMRSPLTGVVFALELTHDVNMLLPLLGRRLRRARLHRAGAAALDPDREDRAARLPPQPRVRDRSARDPVRARGDADQRRGAPADAPYDSLRQLAARRPAAGPQRSIRWSATRGELDRRRHPRRPAGLAERALPDRTSAPLARILETGAGGRLSRTNRCA